MRYRIEYNKLAAITKPVNLGQGFPDYEPPERITNFLTEVASEKNLSFYQYARGMVIHIALQILNIFILEITVDIQLFKFYYYLVQS